MVRLLAAEGRMTESHVVSALRAKRAEISGHVHDLERKLARHRVNLANIDATIRLFAPELNPDTIPPKRTYRRTRYFTKGELSRRILDALRKADGNAIAARDIAKGAITDKGLPADLDAVTEMVLTVLRRLCKRGALVKSGTSRNARWRLPAA
jgi:hypothetical protein